MVVASVVNLVDRTEILIEKLDKLLESTVYPDFLYVSVAKEYPRLKKKYPEEKLKILQEKLETYPIPNKLVVYEEDLGTSLKLLTPLENHQLQEGDWILTFDDDVGLFPTALECLKSCAETVGRDAVYTIMGVRSHKNEEGKEVAVDFIHGERISNGHFYPVEYIGGFRGVLYPYESLQHNFKEWCAHFIEGYKALGKVAVHDDHIFNSYLQKKKIACRMVDVHPKILTGDQWYSELNYEPVTVDNGIFQREVKEDLEIFEDLLSKMPHI